MSVNSVEDYKYTIAFEVDGASLEKKINASLKKSLNLVKNFESKVIESFRNIAKFQGQKARESFETQKKFLIKTQDTARTIEKKFFESRLEQYKSFYKQVNTMNKNSTSNLKEELKTSKMNNGRKQEGSIIDKAVNTMVRGALYRVGGMVLNSATTSFHNFTEQDLLIRQTMMKAKGNGFNPKYDELLKAIQGIGNTTRFTNNEVASAMEKGATLGLKNDLATVVQLSANFAQAANKELPESLEKITMMFNAFSVKGEQAQKDFIDNLFYISNNSALDIQRASEGFKQFAPIGKQAGLSTETMMTSLAVLNSSGLVGSQAGTAMQAMINNITNAKKREKLEQLIGTSIADSYGNLDLRKILGGLNEKLKNVNNVDRLAIFQDLFNIRGAKAVNMLVNDEKLAEYDKLYRGFSSSKNGVSNAVIEQNAGVGGQFKLMTSVLNSFTQTLNNTLAPLLIPMFKGIKSSIIGLDKIIKKFPNLIRMATLFISVLFSKAVFQYISNKLSGFQKEMGSILKLANLQKIAFAGIGILILSGISILANFINKNEELKKSWQSLKESLGKLLTVIFDLLLSVVSSIFDFNLELETTEDRVKVVKTTMEKVKEVIELLSKQITSMKGWVEQHKTLLKIVAIIAVVLKFIVIIGKVMSAIITIIGVIAPIMAKIMTIIEVIATTVATFSAVVSGLIVAAIVAIVGLVYLLYKHWETVKEKVYLVWEGLKSLGEKVAEIGVAIVNAIVNPFKSAYEWLSKMLGLSANAAPKIIEKREQGKQSKLVDYNKQIRRHAVGTDYFKGGLTTVDEIGDEAIWLPNGSMIAHNTTTRDMLMQLKDINYNQKNAKFNYGNSKQGITINEVIINTNSNNGKELAHDFINELANLSFQ